MMMMMMMMMSLGLCISMLMFVFTNKVIWFCTISSDLIRYEKLYVP